MITKVLLVRKDYSRVGIGEFSLKSTGESGWSPLALKQCEWLNRKVSDLPFATCESADS